MPSSRSSAATAARYASRRSRRLDDGGEVHVARVVEGRYLVLDRVHDAADEGALRYFPLEAGHIFASFII